MVAIGPDVDSEQVIFVTAAEKRRLPVAADFMRSLLEQNHAWNQVKIGYDKDGDLSVRMDGTPRLDGAEYFRRIVTQDRSPRTISTGRSSRNFCRNWCVSHSFAALDGGGSGSSRPACRCRRSELHSKPP